MDKIKQARYIEIGIIICITIFSLSFFINRTLANTFIRIAFLLTLINLIKQNTFIFKWHYYKRYLIPIMIFFIIPLFFLFFSVNFYNSILNYEAWLKMLIPFIVIILLPFNKNTLYFLLGISLLSFLANDVYTIYAHFINGVNRAGGFYNETISFASLLLIYIPIFLTLFIKKEDLRFKLLFVALLFINLLALFANASRMAWFITSIDFLLLFFLLLRTWHKKLIFTVLFIGLLACLYNFNERVNLQVNNVFDSNNISSRGHYYYLRDGYNLFLHNPYVGVGLGNFPEAISKQNLISNDSKENLKYESAIKINNTSVMSHAHNDLVTFLAQFGIIGGLAYLFLFISILYITFTNWYREKNIIDLSMFLITINFLLHGLVDYNFANLNSTTIYFFILSLYIKYSDINSNDLFSEETIKKKYVVYLYVYIIFIVLLRVISRYLIKNY